MGNFYNHPCGVYSVFLSAVIAGVLCHLLIQLNAEHCEVLFHKGLNPHRLSRRRFKMRLNVKIIKDEPNYLLNYRTSNLEEIDHYLEISSSRVYIKVWRGPERWR